MGIRGRIPQPTVLKIMRGNPGRRPLNRSEPRPAPGVPDPPDFLSPAAQEEWRRVTDLLNRIGMLTELDRALLAAYCQAWADYTRLAAELEAEGPIIIGATGVPIGNPKARLLRQTYGIIERCCNHFGFSPAARARKTATEDGGFGRSAAR